MACPTGTLTAVKYLGVPKSDEVTCTNLLAGTKHIAEKLEERCYTDFDAPAASRHSSTGSQIHHAKGHASFAKYYEENCLGKARCTIPLGGIQGAAGLKPECQTLLEQRWYHSASASAADKAKLKTALASKGGVKDAPADTVEPWMLAMSQCQQEMVTLDVKQLNRSVEVQKKDFGIVVVFIDFICVFIFIFFTFFLESRQREYAENFEQQTITMSDFTLELSNLPRDGFFNGKEQVLRTMLWDQLEQVIDDQYKVKWDDESRAIDFARQEEYNIVDITFAKTDTGDSILLDQMNSLRIKKNKISSRLEKAALRTAKQRGSIQKDFDKVDAKYQKLRSKYFSEYDQAAGGDDGCGTCETDKKVRPDNESVVRAYVTFRSMEGMELVVDAYDQSKSSRFWVSFCRCICTRKWKSLKMKYINNEWPEPRVAELPDAIQWENMGIGAASRRIRSTFTLLVATLILVGACIGIVYFKSLSKVTADTQYLIPNSCPVATTKAHALTDHLIKNIEDR